jgi:hypothetical protein
LLFPIIIKKCHSAEYHSNESHGGIIPGLQLNAINYAPVDAKSFDENKMNVAQLKNLDLYRPML